MRLSTFCGLRRDQEQTGYTGGTVEHGGVSKLVQSRAGSTFNTGCIHFRQKIGLSRDLVIQKEGG